MTYRVGELEVERLELELLRYYINGYRRGQVVAVREASGGSIFVEVAGRARPRPYLAELKASRVIWAGDVGELRAVLRSQLQRTTDPILSDLDATSAGRLPGAGPAGREASCVASGVRSLGGPRASRQAVTRRPPGRASALAAGVGRACPPPPPGPACGRPPVSEAASAAP